MRKVHAHTHHRKYHKEIFADSNAVDSAVLLSITTFDISNYKQRKVRRIAEYRTHLCMFYVLLYLCVCLETKNSKRAVCDSLCVCLCVCLSIEK